MRADDNDVTIPLYAGVVKVPTLTTSGDYPCPLKVPLTFPDMTQLRMRILAEDDKNGAKQG